MKVLVIGGTRYFGRRLVQLLIEHGHEVSVLTRGNALPKFNNVRFFKADRADEIQFQCALGDEEFDLVYDQICMKAQDALVSSRHLRDRVGHYVLTSTLSVYAPGSSIVEEDFDPWTYAFDREDTVELKKEVIYPEAKRRAESVITGEFAGPISIARLPIVLGSDDFTRRLHWHVERVFRSEPIFLGLPETKRSYVSATGAAEGLFRITSHPKGVGAVNISSPGGICHRELVDWIEMIVGRKAILVDSIPKEDVASAARSPFSAPGDYVLSTAKAEHLQLLEPQGDWLLKNWLPPLIETIWREMT